MKCKTWAAIGLIALGLIGWGTFGCADSNPPQQAAVDTPEVNPTPISTPMPPPTVTPTPSPFWLTVVHTNDIQGYTEPCG